jgi:recombination protein RecT
MMAGQVVRTETGEMVPRQGPAENLRGLLERMLPEIQKALPRTGALDPERFARIALTTVKKTPKLLECRPESILAGVMSAAQLGLTVDGVTGDAYLVPYKNTAVLIPGYRGLMRMARNSGRVAKIEARCVYEGDEFRVAYGTDAQLVHNPDPWGSREQGDIIGVYALAKVLDDRGNAYDQWETMSVEEVEKVRARSRAAEKGPWVSDWPEMAKKTVVRRLAKYLPLDTEEQRAVAVEEQVDAGVYNPAEEEGRIVDVEAAVARAEADADLSNLAAEGDDDAQAREEWITRIEELAKDHKVNKATLEEYAGGPLAEASVEVLQGVADKLEGLK